MYAGSERIKQFTDRTNSGYERLLYVHEDLQGNTRYYTKDNGQSFAELTYDAWGMPESPNKLLNNDHGNYVYATYTGHIFDTTHIYFAEARFYDAQTRQWLAMDPIKSGNNWYQYCYSNPLIYMDPDGQFVILTSAVVKLLSKAIVGFGTSMVVSILEQGYGTDGLFSEMDFSWDRVNPNIVLIDSVTGAISGLSDFAGVAKIGFDVANAVIMQVMSNVVDNRPLSEDLVPVIFDTLITSFMGNKLDLVRAGLFFPDTFFDDMWEWTANSLTAFSGLGIEMISKGFFSLFSACGSE